MASDLLNMIGNDERVLWRGKPDKKCFLLESIFNPLLPFALIWGLIDFGIMGAALSSKDGVGEAGIFLVFFFALHLMPVWIYLGGVLMSWKRYDNTSFLITDKAIYVSGGVFACTYEMKPFAELSHINIHRGIFDQYLGVGDVVSMCEHASYNSHSRHSHGAGITICDIKDYQKVFALVKELQTNIYSDTMFPNDLRPRENHGYRTKYTGGDISKY
ncbi:MAG: PH domain-containing protein [Candidatus Gastranaerophilales bacterium]|nr:PH domain-containing protein [Candidatus Gastranaerophilales bacterium]